MGAPFRGPVTTQSAGGLKHGSASALAAAETGAGTPVGALGGRTPQNRNKVLERVARGAPLPEVLELLAREIQSAETTLLASVMLLDSAGRHLHVASAPDLASEYCQAIDGISVTTDAGFFGAATHRGERIIVGDVASDPLCNEVRDLAIRHGLRACWSQPIYSNRGKVLGVLAMYYRSPRTPSNPELDVVADVANVASIAIERARADERIARLMNLRRSRGEISQIILHTKTETQLLSEVCRIAVEYGGMRLAWIGKADKSTKRIEPLAQHGSGQGYLQDVAISSDADLAEGRGPTGRVFRGGGYAIVNDFATDASVAPWCEPAKKHGFRSSGCFAINRSGKVYATLSVYSSQSDSFDGETITLLQGVAKDVGLALDAIDQDQLRRRTLEALHHSERHFRAYFERSMVGMAAIGLDMRWIEVNDALCSMLGYTREQMLAQTWADLIHPNDLAGGLAIWQRLCAAESDEYEANTRYLHKDGQIVETHVAGRAVRARTAKDSAYVVLLVENITGRKRAEQALREKNEFLDSILQSEPDCVMVVGLGGQLMQMNQAGLGMFGVRSLEEAETSGLLSFVLPQYHRAFLDLHAAVCRGGSGVLEYQVRANDGVVRWLEMHATPLRGAGGTISALLGISRDVSEKKRSEELFWRQTNFDALTGLPNRYMFQDRLAQELKKARRTGAVLALLLIDLDYFKEINSTLGHETGDALLVAVAKRISSCVRESDTIARLGGDEFTVILPQLSSVASAEHAAQNIITRLGEVFSLRNEAIFLSASIGITYFPHDAQTVDALLKNADQAMYVAKRQGRNRVGYFTAKLQDEANNRLRLINDLRGASAAGQFEVYFQPVIDLARGRISGAEALLRWHHPTRGMVPPVEFIALAEETGLIISVGDWVFRESARRAKLWSEQLGNGFWIGVNNSPVQFRDANSILSWLGFLKEIGLPGEHMTIEITEGLLLDADANVANVLRRLHESGVRVAIDDFGTGYSSLSYLHKFQIDCLKIDQSFVRNLPSERSARALSESIIVMAHKLGLTVVAEGVETAEQLEFLVSAGCDYAQGYYFSRPIPAQEFDALLKNGLPALRNLSSSARSTP